MSGVVTNITTWGIQRRRRMGIALTLISVAGAAVVLGTGAPRWTRLVLFVPVALAVLTLLQVRNKTCVVLSVSGSRERESGGYERMSADECTIVRRRTASMIAQTVVIAAAVTAAIWLV